MEGGSRSPESIRTPLTTAMGFPGGSDGKESACNAGDLDLIPRSVSFLGEGNGNPLQCSRLENPIGKGAWQTIVHRVTKVRYD